MLINKIKKKLIYPWAKQLTSLTYYNFFLKTKFTLILLSINNISLIIKRIIQIQELSNITNHNYFVSFIAFYLILNKPRSKIANSYRKSSQAHLPTLSFTLISKFILKSELFRAESSFWIYFGL